MSDLIINSKKVKYPVIQGGMGIGISLSGLAGAAMNNGCVGTISSAQNSFKVGSESANNFELNMIELKKEIALARKHSKEGVLGVNVMYALENYDEFIRELVKEDIDFIITGAGLPLDMPKGFVNTNVKPAVIVSSAKALRLLCKRWMKNYNMLPEFAVVEGPLAGGHLGFTKEELLAGKVKTLEELTIEVVEEAKKISLEYGKKISIIPAGGITNKSEVDNFLELGADGVQIATKFICTDECDASIEYKEAIARSTEEDMVEVPSPVGMPGRAVKNDFSEIVKETNIPVKKCVGCLRVCKKIDIPYCIAEKLGGASMGDTTNGLVFSGANGFKVSEIKPFKEHLKDLVSIV